MEHLLLWLLGFEKKKFHCLQQRNPAAELERESDHNRDGARCGAWSRGRGPAPTLSAPVAGALSAPFSLGKGLLGRVENDRLFLTQALYPTVLVLTSIIITYS